MILYRSSQLGLNFPCVGSLMAVVTFLKTRSLILKCQGFTLVLACWPWGLSIGSFIVQQPPLPRPVDPSSNGSFLRSSLHHSGISCSSLFPLLRGWQPRSLYARQNGVSLVGVRTVVLYAQKTLGSSLAISPLPPPAKSWSVWVRIDL